MGISTAVLTQLTVIVLTSAPEDNLKDVFSKLFINIGTILFIKYQTQLHKEMLHGCF